MASQVAPQVAPAAPQVAPAPAPQVAPAPAPEMIMIHATVSLRSVSHNGKRVRVKASPHQSESSAEGPTLTEPAQAAGLAGSVIGLNSKRHTP